MDLFLGIGFQLSGKDSFFEFCYKVTVFISWVSKNAKYLLFINNYLLFLQHA